MVGVGASITGCKDRRVECRRSIEDCAAGYHANRFALAYLILQVAFPPLVAMISLLATNVNTICVQNASCNEIIIATSIEIGYNDYRLQ